MTSSILSKLLWVEHLPGYEDAGRQPLEMASLAGPCSQAVGEVLLLVLHCSMCCSRHPADSNSWSISPALSPAGGTAHAAWRCCCGGLCIDTPFHPSLSQRTRKGFEEERGRCGGLCTLSHTPSAWLVECVEAKLVEPFSKRRKRLAPTHPHVPFHFHTFPPVATFAASAITIPSATGPATLAVLARL